MHPGLAKRVVDLYSSGHFDHAVLDAFKFIEHRLLEITGKSDANRMELLKETFNPNTGTLQDPKAWQSEREGMYKFLDGAFLVFRNPPAHRFVGLSKEEAFDRIVLANRLLTFIEEGEGRLRSRPTAKLPNQVLEFQQGIYGEKAFVLDANNDGEMEILVQSYDRDQIFQVFENAEGAGHGAEVEKVDLYGETLDILLADVDNDGQHEIVCNSGWTSESGLLFYKYRQGKYKILRKEPQSVADDERESWFVSAHVTDFDGDDRLEIVAEPWRTVPSDLLPPEHEPGSYDQGRVRYVWRWNESESHFELLSRELLYVGGR